jgi:membrane protein implicated in regulation of membrane protease activity
MDFLAVYREFLTFDKMWLTIAIVAFIVKCFTKEYVSLCIGLAGLIAFLFAETIFDHRYLYQIITFIVAAVFLSFLAQPYAIRKNEERRMKQSMEKNVPFFQKTGKVIERIDNMAPSGKILVEGTEMKARSATGITHEIDEEVRIVDHDRNILIVV